MPIAISLLLGVLLLQQCADLPPWPLLLALTLLALLLWRRVPWLAALPLGFCYAGLHAWVMLAGGLPPGLEGVDLLAEGEILSLPQVDQRRARFEFQIQELYQGEAKMDFSGKVRLSWYGQEPPSLNAGERWRLLIRLRPPRGFANPGTFDYEAWLWQEGIQATGYVRRSALNQPLGAGSVLGWWQRQRQLLGEAIEARSATGAAGLIKALTIGDYAGFTDPQWQAFRITGTTHLVAISGQHISMVAGVLLLLASWLWRRSARLCLLLAAPRAAASMALLGAGFYAALAGFSVPTQRALIMLFTLLLPRILGRQGRPWQGMAYALILVLLLDPRAVLSAGFILSFAAAGAILWGLALRAPGESYLVTLWRMQWVVLLVLTPLLILLFHQTSLLALPVNLLAVPWFGLVLVPLAFVAVLLLLLAPALGGPLLGLLSPLFGFTLDLLQWAGDADIGLLDVAQRPAALVLLAFLGALWLVAPLRLPARYLGLALLAPMLAWREPPLPTGAFALTLLDVGQGLAVVVRTANHLLLYDAGPAFGGEFTAGDAVVVPYLKGKGLERVDRLLLSHAARDHTGGAPDVLRQLRVGRLLANTAPEGAAAVDPCVAGEHWRWDGVDFRILHPAPSETGRGNNASCVLWVDNGAGRLLLTGDLEREGEAALLARYGPLLAGAAVQVGHHGSRSSSSPPWVAATRAPLALISSGAGNPFGFPAPEVVARWRDTGARVVNTADSGAIEVPFDPGQGPGSVSRFRERTKRYWHRSADASAGASAGLSVTGAMQ